MFLARDRRLRGCPTQWQEGVKLAGAPGLADGMVYHIPLLNPVKLIIVSGPSTLGSLVCWVFAGKLSRFDESVLGGERRVNFIGTPGSRAGQLQLWIWDLGRVLTRNPVVVRGYSLNQ